MPRSSIAALALVMVAFGAFTASAGWPVAWSVGVIKTFDPRARSLVVRQGAHQMTFALSPAADVLEGRDSLDPDALSKSVGRRVKVRYAIVNEVKVADRIEITAP